MSIDKEYFYKLIEAVPKSKWSEVERQLKIMAMPEETPTEEELKAIRLGEEEITDGEYTTYTVEEFKQEFLNE